MTDEYDLEGPHRACRVSAPTLVIQVVLRGTRKNRKDVDDKYMN